MSGRSIAFLARCRFKGERWSPCCRMRRQTSDGFLAVSRRMHRVVQTSGKCTEVVGLVLVGPLRLPQAPLSTDIELCTRNDAWSRGVVYILSGWQRTNFKSMDSCLCLSQRYWPLTGATCRRTDRISSLWTQTSQQAWPDGRGSRAATRTCDN